jgi:hypothetical protein
LSYFVMTLIGAIDDQELIDNYIEVQRNEVVPDLNKNASIIPFYDVENDVNNILQMLESEDPFNDE